MVLNELIDFAKRHMKNCFLLKVDFEKAFDNVNWNFLMCVLRCFGFGEKVAKMDGFVCLSCVIISTSQR